MTRGRALVLFVVGVLLGLCIRVGVDQGRIEAIEKDRDMYRESAQMMLDELHRIVGAEVMRQQGEPRRGPAL